MLFHFNFTVNYLQSSDPFLFNQRLSPEILDVLILRDSMETIREREFPTIPVVEPR